MMFYAIWVKAILKSLLLPPTGLLVLAATGLALLTRFPRVGRSLAAAGVGGLLVISTPAVGDLLARLVDRSPPFDAARAHDVEAIVILGGGVRRDAVEYGGDTLGALTLERVRYGARLARLTGLPVMVSGGSVLGGVAEAQLMRAALENEFGVPVRWVEPSSRNTRENAAFSATMLKRDRVQRIAVVSHGFDVYRATAEFAAEGIDAVAAPTAIRRDGGSWSALDFVPSVAGLQRSYYVVYEIVANLVRLIAHYSACVRPPLANAAVL